VGTGVGVLLGGGVGVDTGVGVLVGGGVFVSVSKGAFVGPGKGFELDSGVGELQATRVKPTAASATSTTSLILGITSSRVYRKIRARPLKAATQ